MIKALKALFEEPAHETKDERQHRLHLAAAALLIETARADFTQGQEEEQALTSLLSSTLKLDSNEVQALITQATTQVDESISLYEFTRVINDHYTPQQKLQLIHAMWTVAYADGNIDKYEEHLIRQVAELTYVAHEDYIRAKLSAGEENG
ncbi:MAG: TerB family tellurite resistance protein [Halieaceae bacterium]